MCILIAAMWEMLLGIIVKNPWYPLNHNYINIDIPLTRLNVVIDRFLSITCFEIKYVHS